MSVPYLSRRKTALTNTHQTTKSTWSENDILRLLPVWAKLRLDLLSLLLHKISEKSLQTREPTYLGLLCEILALLLNLLTLLLGLVLYVLGLSLDILLDLLGVLFSW